jgi:hypothetical protein
MLSREKCGKYLLSPGLRNILSANAAIALSSISRPAFLASLDLLDYLKIVNNNLSTVVQAPMALLRPAASAQIRLASHVAWDVASDVASD